MARGSLGRGPTSPRTTTMPALLVVICLFSTVPSTEAMPVAASSLPSVSTPAGVLVGVLSVAVALSLVAGLVFVLKKIWKILGRNKKDKKKQSDDQKNQQQAQTDHPPRRIGIVDSSALDRTGQSTEEMFNEFIYDWNEHSDKEKEDFINEMIKDFPDSVTPSMVMDALVVMLSEEINPAVWKRMLRFTMMLERDLFHWDQTHLRKIADEDKTIPKYTHDRFQNFLVIQAEQLLRTYGDVARPGEAGEAGFMRFIAYLFGFVCNSSRILQLMGDTWARDGFLQTDASRAVVWVYARWIDDPLERVRGCPMEAKYDPVMVHRQSKFGNKYYMFNKLMQELKDTPPSARPDEGSKVQHLLFALGCGNEPDSAQGPLAYMCDRKFSPNSEFVEFDASDYLWLMLGRDLAMGNAWKWMCDKKLSEHDRMCNRFELYDDNKLYENIVDMVTKYEQDFLMKKGKCLMNVAVAYSPDVVEKINFGEHRAWCERYHWAKKTIGADIKAWLVKHEKKNRLRGQYRLSETENPENGLPQHFQ